MWAIVRRYPVALLVAVLLVTAGAWVWVTRIGPQLTDTDRRQAIYDRFEPYPGADQVSSRRYEQRGDGRPTGHYGLAVVYRLPNDATAASVLDHYRAQIPSGWREASDQTCLDVMGALPAPPKIAAGQPTMPGSSTAMFQLQFRGSELTILTDRSDPRVGRVDGLTIALSRSGEGKYVTLDAPTLSCAGDGLDPVAAAFDAP